MATRGMPVIVPIRAGKCGGCHLKVSSEVESAARGKTADVGDELSLKMTDEPPESTATIGELSYRTSAEETRIRARTG